MRYKAEGLQSLGISNSHRTGSILLLVLVVVTMMSLTVGSYLALMQNEHHATRYSGRRLQARMLVESGVEYLQAILAQADEEIDQQGGLSDNSDLLQSILVIEDTLPDFRGRFTVLASDMEDGLYDGLRYGIENESAKLNLNTLVEEEENDAARERLMAIPSIGAAVADAILDWLDEDDSPREFGAEQSHYQALSPAYQPRNGPLTALDELLMIRGITPELLYGLDSNRSYKVDAQEQRAQGILESVENKDGEMNRGISAYLTLHSRERLETSSGKEKIDVNAPDLEQLYEDLRKATNETEAKFIVAYRQNGPAAETPVGETIDSSQLEIDWQKGAKTEIGSLFDLVDVRVSVQAKENEPTQILESPWQDDPTTYRNGFLNLLDHAQVGDAKLIAGRINIDHASRPVLKSIPGMTEIVVDQILNQRESVSRATGDEVRHPVWILAKGLVTLEEMKQLAPYVTSEGDVFSTQVVGYFEGTSPRARAEVILDRSAEKPKIVSLQELSQLGPGPVRNVLGEESDNQK
ncbi:MAG: general secretion pathway protein GspK [Planctomycetes bacterium]|nr:general secretion pathway protein GspK [Planctomycetota bacterium]